MARTLRIVNYAVDGSGVGHLTRLTAINRWIRRYTAALGVKADIWFLTSTEADGLLFRERFPSFKVPSKTAIEDAGADKTTYLALAKQWIWHSIGLLRPDLFIVDTFPRGSFGELASAIDLCPKRAFVYRPTRDEFASRPDFQAMLPLYHAIIVPDHEGQAHVPVTAVGARARVRHVGPVMLREQEELLDRKTARARLGVPEGKRAVLVSFGGGGDPGVARAIEAVFHALRDDRSIHLVIAAGALYRGGVIRGERVTWLTEPGVLAEHMHAFDLAICAAGYNTFHELMHAGVPAIFVPQDKIADDQRARAQRAVAARAARILPELTEAAIRTAVAAMLDDDRAHVHACEAAHGLVPTNHARDAASELLRLVLPEHDVEAAEDLVSDDLLADAAARGAPIEHYFQVTRALVGDADAPTQGSDRVVARDAAVRLISICGPSAAAARSIETVAKKLVGGDLDERVRTTTVIVEALAAFDDWTGAALFVQALPGERRASDETARDLAAFLGAVKMSGGDPYRALAAIGRATAAGAKTCSAAVHHAGNELEGAQGKDGIALPPVAMHEEDTTEELP